MIRVKAEALFSCLASLDRVIYGINISKVYTFAVNLDPRMPFGKLRLPAHANVTAPVAG
jgi:hypothetical protein